MTSADDDRNSGWTISALETRSMPCGGGPDSPRPEMWEDSTVLLFLFTTHQVGTHHQKKSFPGGHFWVGANLPAKRITSLFRPYSPLRSMSITAYSGSCRVSKPPSLVKRSIFVSSFRLSGAQGNSPKYPCHGKFLPTTMISLTSICRRHDPRDDTWYPAQNSFFLPSRLFQNRCRFDTGTRLWKQPHKCLLGLFLKHNVFVYLSAQLIVSDLMFHETEELIESLSHSTQRVCPKISSPCLAQHVLETHPTRKMTTILSEPSYETFTWTVVIRPRASISVNLLSLSGLTLVRHKSSRPPLSALCWLRSSREVV